MRSSDLQYLLALQHVPNLGDATAKKLIRYAGSAEAVFKEKKANLLKIDGVGNFKIEGLLDTVHQREAEKELRFIEQKRIKCLSYKEEELSSQIKTLSRRAHPFVWERQYQPRQSKNNQHYRNKKCYQSRDYVL